MGRYWGVDRPVIIKSHHALIRSLSKLITELDNPADILGERKAILDEPDEKLVWYKAFGSLSSFCLISKNLSVVNNWNLQ